MPIKFSNGKYGGWGANYWKNGPPDLSGMCGDDTPVEVFQGMLKRFNDPEYCDLMVMTEDGKKYYCSKFALCCGSEVFHRMLSKDMEKSGSGSVSIQDAASSVVKTMLLFLHGGNATLSEYNVLPLSSLAKRYAIQPLEKLCGDFLKARFNLTPGSCCMILMQTHKYPECPSYLKEQCENMIRQNAVRVWFGTFPPVPLSFEAVQSIMNNALPRMFAEEDFPQGYVELCEVLLLWLDSMSNQNPNALDLIGLVEFPSLGFTGISKLLLPDKGFIGRNWVRSHPELENRVLDALGIARVNPQEFSYPRDFVVSVSGRYTLVCRYPGSSTTSLSTFKFTSGDTLLIRISRNMCAVFCKCAASTPFIHLIAAEGCFKSTCDLETQLQLDLPLASEYCECSCPFSGTVHGEMMRGLGVVPFWVKSWINSKRLEELYTCQPRSRCPVLEYAKGSPPVRIYYRPEKLSMDSPST